MKKLIITILLSLIVALAIFLSMFAINKKEVVTQDTIDVVETAKPYETPIVEVKDLTVFNERKAINSDYIGELKIEGLLNEYVVQTVDNEYYLHKNFNKEEYSSGSVYMDYRNTMDDQNLILYGHYVYKDESKIFGPLHLLKEKENYELYKNISIDFGEETRNYVVSKVFYYVMDSKTLIYYLTNYTSEELTNYLNAVKAVEFYDTGVEINDGDKFLTLQTCVRKRDDLRLIIVAKEVE